MVDIPPPPPLLRMGRCRRCCCHCKTPTWVAAPSCRRVAAEGVAAQCSRSTKDNVGARQTLFCLLSIQTAAVVDFTVIGLVQRASRQRQ